MNTNILHAQIPPGSNFSDAFWDDQYKGVGAIFNRLKNSKETCEEIKRLYESRAQIEQEYGESLLKLAATSQVGKHEEGSFAETLLCIPSTLETTARAHIDLAQQLKDHLEMPLSKFLKEQREIRKTQHVQIENLKQLKNLHQNEFSRNKKEMEEQRQLVAVAEQVYKRAIDNLNAVNEKWILDWKRSADIHQEMEIKRITYLRSTLWSFSSMMTSTFNIDEECCDRIRTALEITDIQKDIIDFVRSQGTGTKLPSPVTYKTPFVPLNKNLYSQHTSSESLSHSVTILTNPDEELKSVDRQLQQLEQSQSPRVETAPDFPTPVTSSQISSNHVTKFANIESKQSLPPIIIDSSRSAHTALSLQEHAPNPIEVDRFNDPKLHSNKNQPLSAQFGDVQLADEQKPKDEIQPRYDRSAPESPSSQHEGYRKKMSRSPKDEKWVISSIRRPQQAMTNQMDESPNRHSRENTPVHVEKASKPRKPVIPLTIDIPNSVNNTKPQMAAHQAIEDARRHSQMSPVDMSRPLNRTDDYGGPTPWQDNGNTARSMPYNHHLTFPQHAPIAHDILSLEGKKKSSKNKSDSNTKSTKESKTSRFSHFFTGNKKKKEKNQQVQSELQDIPDHQTVYPTTIDKDVYNAQHNNPLSSASNNRFICYVKAQWPFEATIDTEMSFDQNETLGILHKQLDGWWQAERLTKEAAGKRGLVPGNYMVNVPMHD